MTRTVVLGHESGNFATLLLERFREETGLPLVPDAESSEPYPVPALDTFVDESEQELEFLPAADLEALAQELIKKHRGVLYGLRDLRIHCLWKRQGGESGGSPVYGACQKANALLRYWADSDFIVWLAADNIEAADYSRFQVEACLFHQLMHIEVDEKGKRHVRPHDAELFLAEFSRYGFWDQRLEQVGRAVQQLPLFEEEDKE